MKTCIFIKGNTDYFKFGEFIENYVPINSPNVEESIVFLKSKDYDKKCTIVEETWEFNKTNNMIDVIRNLYLQEVK